MYRDSDDRLIATTAEPKIQLGEIRKLKVVDTGRIGAFLDWGLEKDLLLPFREQTQESQSGGSGAGGPLCGPVGKAVRHHEAV